MKMTFTATKSSQAVIGDGEHIVKIVSIEKTENSLGDSQLEVTFENEDGVQITSWFNFKGYKKDNDGNYIDKKGKVIKGLLDDDGQLVPEKAALRVEDVENTKKSIGRFTNMANNAGIEEGEDFEVSDLKDSEVGIVVGSKKASTGKTYKEVLYTISPEEVTEDSLF